MARTKSKKTKKDEPVEKAQFIVEHAEYFKCSRAEAKACFEMKEKHARMCIREEGYYWPGMERSCKHQIAERKNG